VLLRVNVAPTGILNPLVEREACGPRRREDRKA